MTIEQDIADIAKRNAGQPVLTVYSDGTWVVQGYLDANCDEYLLTIPLSDLQMKDQK